MKKTEKTIQEIEVIIAEYLIGDTTYRKLQEKYNMDFRIIHSWVSKFKGTTVRKENTPKAFKAPEHQEVLQM